MKTLENIKDEIALDIFNLSDWDQLLQIEDCVDYIKAIDEVAKRYAEEALKEAAERAKAKIEFPSNNSLFMRTFVNKESILSLIKELK